MSTSHLKSETAKEIATKYTSKYGQTNIFDNADEVELCISLAKQRGARTKGQIYNSTIAFLYA